MSVNSVSTPVIKAVPSNNTVSSSAKNNEKPAEKKSDKKFNDVSMALVCIGAAVVGGLLGKKYFDNKEFSRFAKLFKDATQKTDSLDSGKMYDFMHGFIKKSGLKSGDNVCYVPIKYLKEMYKENKHALKALEKADYSDNTLFVFFEKDGKLCEKIEGIITSDKVSEPFLKELLSGNDILSCAVKDFIKTKVEPFTVIKGLEGSGLDRFCLN